MKSLSLLACAAPILIMCAVWTWLSQDFIYGEAHAQRPIGLFVALWIFGWAGYVTACYGVARRARSSRGAGLILLIGLLARLFLWPSSLIQEDDPYRYLADGMCLTYGVNPFTVTPVELQRVAAGGDAPGLPDAFITSLRTPQAQEALARVSYPRLRTIYPPLAQAAFALGSWLTPWDWRGQRAVALLADLLTVVALAALLRSLKLPLTWLVVYLWNPLVLKEIANSAHIDALATALLIGSLAALATSAKPSTKHPHVRRFFAPVASGMLLGASALAKLYPLAVLLLSAAACIRLASRPFDSSAAPSRSGLALRLSSGLALRLSSGLAAGALHLGCVLGTLSLGYAAFAGAGAGNLTESLWVYLTQWNRNAGLRQVLDFATGVGPLAPATVRIFITALVLLGLAALMLFFIRRILITANGQSCVEWLLKGSMAVLAAWLLTAKAVFPWYAVPLIALAASRPRFWVLGLSGAFAAYYLLFLAEYRAGPAAASWKAVITAVEHGAIWLGLGWAWWKSQGARTAAFWRL